MVLAAILAIIALIGAEKEVIFKVRFVHNP